MKIYQLLALPEILQPDSLYFILNGDFAESYLTDDNGVAKFIGNTSMIENLAPDTVAELSDVTIYDFATLNTPLADALAGKATAAQGALADSAVQEGDSPSFVDVDATGTVTAAGMGIGMTPIHSFDIKSNGGMGFYSDSGVYIALMGMGQSAVLGGGTSDFGIRASTGGLLFAAGGATERMRITSTGNVGIGTTSPITKLDILAADLANQLRVSNTSANLTNKYGAIMGSHYANSEENVTGMLITSNSSATGGTVSIGGGISLSLIHI